MVAFDSSKVDVWVRFPSLAPNFDCDIGVLMAACNASNVMVRVRLPHVAPIFVSCRFSIKALHGFGKAETTGQYRQVAPIYGHDPWRDVRLISEFALDECRAKVRFLTGLPMPL